MSESVGQVPAMGQATFSPPIWSLQVTDFTGNLVGRDGFEPSTNWLKASLSYSPHPSKYAGFWGQAVPFNLYAIDWKPMCGAVLNSEWDTFRPANPLLTSRKLAMV